MAHSLKTRNRYATDFLVALQQGIQGAQATRERMALDLSAALAETAALIEKACGGGSKVLFVGNGGSAGICSHMAIDFWKNGGLEALAFNDGSLLTCLGNDFGFDQVFARPVQCYGKAGDVLVAISSSGRSPDILNAVAAAREKQCQVLTFSGFDSANPLRTLGDYNFYVASHTYGIVETTHQALIHAILDASMLARGLMTAVEGVK